jgi:hypothetical protein
MKPLNSLRGVGVPPSREETHDTLDRPPAKEGRRKKSGRTEQFNIRVQPRMEERFKVLAERDGQTNGAFWRSCLPATRCAGCRLRRA